MKLEDYAGPEELRRLGAALLTVLVAIAVAALFEFIVVPSLRIANRPPRGGAEIPPQGATGWLDPAEVPATRSYRIPPVDPETVLRATPELVRRGGELFARQCVQCHGAEGRGDGPAAATMTPRPRNLSRPEGWKNGFGLAGIFKTATNGIPGGAMAAFETVPAKDRMALAHFVQSQAEFPRPSEDAAGLAVLAKSFASAGEIVPNKIPASLAMQKLASEYAAPKALVLSGVGARAIDDPLRAAAWLQASNAWRGGPRALAQAAAAQAPGNGFAVSAAGLSAAEWGALYAQLRGR